MSAPQTPSTGQSRSNVTNLTPANTQSGSLRTTVPLNVVKALGLTTSDTLRWEVSGNSVSVKKQTDAA